MSLNKIKYLNVIAGLLVLALSFQSSASKFINDEEARRLASEKETPTSYTAPISTGISMTLIAVIVAVMVPVGTLMCLKKDRLGRFRYNNANAPARLGRNTIWDNLRN